MVTKSELKAKGMAVDGLINMAHFLDENGKIVDSWNFTRQPVGNPKFTANGEVVAVFKAFPLQRQTGQATSEYVIQIYRGDRDVYWTFGLSKEAGVIHHDVARLPNGNVLALVWEHRTVEEWLEAGVDPDQIKPEGCFVDAIWEIEPTGKQSGRVVWRWSAWDNLVQNRYPDLKTFGDPKKVKNRIPLMLARDRSSRSLAELNRIEYDPLNNVIMVRSRAFQEVWGIRYGASEGEDSQDREIAEAGLAFRLRPRGNGMVSVGAFSLIDMAVGRDSDGSSVLGCLTARPVKGEDKVEQFLQVFSISKLMSSGGADSETEEVAVPLRHISLGKQEVSAPAWVRGIGRGWGTCDWVLRFGGKVGFRGEGGPGLQGTLPTGESPYHQNLVEKATQAGWSQLLSVSANF